MNVSPRIAPVHPLSPLHVIVLLLGAALSPATASAADAKYEPIENYEVRQIHGWSVLVNKALLAGEHAELGEQTLAHMGHQLYIIVRRLPAAEVEKLRKVRLWIEFREPHHPCMAYHPDAKWLVEHDMHPEKAKCVEVASAENFLRWTIEQPWMVLHELAHAYHHQFLEGGFDNALVLEAYKQSGEAKLYDEVLRINGRKDRHYATTNQMEYFAEATEAYFGTNDFYPYVRSELAAHDPAMFALLGKLWGDVP